MSIFDRKGQEIKVGTTLKFLVFNKYVQATVHQEGSRLFCIDTKGKRHELYVFQNQLIYPEGVVVEDE